MRVFFFKLLLLRARLRLESLIFLWNLHKLYIISTEYSVKVGTNSEDC